MIADWRGLVLGFALAAIAIFVVIFLIGNIG
jgi:hypothetical protein